jgi:hypothetical protein
LICLTKTAVDWWNFQEWLKYCFSFIWLKVTWASVFFRTHPTIQLRSLNFITCNICQNNFNYFMRNRNEEQTILFLNIIQFIVLKYIILSAFILHQSFVTWLLYALIFNLTEVVQLWVSKKEWMTGLRSQNVKTRFFS